MKRVFTLLLAALCLIAASACKTVAAPSAATQAPAAQATPEPTAPAELPAKEPNGSITQDVITERPLEPIGLTDLIGREMTVTPGSYSRVVCIGADALRLYSYIGDVASLCGVEDIDNRALSAFDDSLRPYLSVYGAALSDLPSCGLGGTDAGAIDAERISACKPDIVISSYRDAPAAERLAQTLGVPVVTIRTGDGVFDRSFRQSVRLLGVLFGRTGLAAALIRFVEAQHTELVKRTGEEPAANGPAKEEAYGTNYELALINAWHAAKTAYPDRFADVDLAEKANAITTAFYGKPLYEELSLSEIYR